MAEVIDELPPRRPGSPSKYPWSDWTDLRPWRIVQGEDFHCDVVSMDGLLRKRASAHGMRVSIRTRDNVLMFQFSEAS